MEEAFYDLGVKDGASRSYYKNGKLKTEDYYNQGIRDSLCRKWWINGQLAFKKEFKSGLCITHMEWDINGRKTLDKTVDDLEEVVIIKNEETPPIPAVSPPAPPPPVAPKVVKVVPPVVKFPDVEAQFPGGPVEMVKWFNANLVYPQTSIEMNEQGRVFVSFVVEADGSITNVRVERGISSDLDREAKRVVSSMPNWIPGENNGRKVRVRCRIPIPFQLH